MTVPVDQQPVPCGTYAASGVIGRVISGSDRAQSTLRISTDDYQIKSSQKLSVGWEVTCIRPDGKELSFTLIPHN